MARVLYVDDERSISRAVHAWLSRDGTEVRRAHSIQGARRCLARHQFDGVFIDLWLGDGSGIELYEHIRERHPELASRVAFVTGDTVPRADVARRLASLGCPVLTKPFDLSDLQTWVEVWAASAARESREAGDARDAFDEPAPAGGDASPVGTPPGDPGAAHP